MVSIAYLSCNVWIKGWIDSPVLKVIYKPAPTSDKTVAYVLVDPNGVAVTDEASETLTSGTEELSIVIGDYLDTQQGIKGFGAGLYFLIVKIVEDNTMFALPLFVSLAGTDVPSGEENLKEVVLVDKVTGGMLRLPPTVSPVPIDDRFEAWAYYNDGTYGRLVKFDATGVLLDTGYHRFTELELEVGFNSFKDMLYYMLMRSWNLPDTVVNRIVSEIEAGNYDDVFKLLIPYHSFPAMGKVIRIIPVVDTANNIYKIKYRLFTYLGELDWQKIFGWGALGCGLAVAGAVAVTALTAGTGAVTLPLVAGACMAGGAVGAGVAVLTSSDSPGDKTVIIKIIDERDKAHQDNNKYYDQAMSVLDEWLEEKKITQDDYNRMKQILGKWKASMDKHIDELASLGTDAYNTGKREEREKTLWYVAGAGLGGTVLGFMLGKR